MAVNHFLFRLSTIVHRHYTPICAIGLLVAVGLFSGCYRSKNNHYLTTPPTGLDYRTPETLAKQIVSADRIIITYRFANHVNKQLQSFSFSVVGRRVKEIIEAVSSSKENSNPSDSMWEWELHFYKGRNSLAAVDFAGSVFLADGEYHDESGVLEKLQQDVLKQANIESKN